MAYHKSLAGVGWVSLVPSGTFPDPIHLAEIESLDFNVTEEDSDLEDAAGDVIYSFTTKRVIEGTITLKDISGSLLAASTRGGTVTAAAGKLGYSQTSAIPTTPFTVTVTNSATFTKDLGVVDLTTGKAMLCDTTSTGTGVYSVSAGAYVFNTADSTHSVLINYQTSSTTQVATDIASATAASAYFQLHCYNPLAAKPWGIYVPAARLPGLSAKFSKGGWSETTLKWKATKDSSNKYFYLYSPE